MRVGTGAGSGRGSTASGAARSWSLNSCHSLQCLLLLAVLGAALLVNRPTVTLALRSTTSDTGSTPAAEVRAEEGEAQLLQEEFQRERAEQRDAAPMTFGQVRRAMEVAFLIVHTEGTTYHCHLY